GNEFTRKDLQQRRLAGAVPSDDRDALARLERQAGLIEQWNMTEGGRNIFEADERHGCLLCGRSVLGPMFEVRRPQVFFFQWRGAPPPRFLSGPRFARDLSV